ncbi:aromatic ring-hydroxylating dioxygenase subunit alpha [Sphingobium sp.]|uniref:aromatic ring-hydroxylating dioxygenase subunit alpha n=1 Tax=Sphingobium sp. TaxID=1912891 RepID=UPI0028BE5DBC|nr:aromatic ring-hydroxylating dioxygenase subunit alpha [Sphingobium sp.]
MNTLVSPISLKQEPHFDAGPEVNYPRNCWWVAAFSSEVTREPTMRWLLDRPVLLYRTQGGDVVALDNRCPHRWAPLSDGKVVGDNIECPYHGLRFSTAGECVLAPSQRAIPPRSTIHAYPVREADPFIWIWMGDPARIDTYDPPPDTSWVNSIVNPHQGSMIVDCNYMLIHDNLMDLTHFGFTHFASLGVSDWNSPPKVTLTDSTVMFRKEFAARPLPAFYASVTGIPEAKPVFFVTEAGWKSPAFHDGLEFMRDPEPGADRRAEFTFYVSHAPTPISSTKTLYHYVLGWDTPLPPEIDLGVGIGVVYGEDKRVLESIQRTVEQDGRGRDFPELHLQADTGQLHARRKLSELMSRE